MCTIGSTGFVIAECRISTKHVYVFLFRSFVRDGRLFENLWNSGSWLDQNRYAQTRTCVFSYPCLRPILDLDIRYRAENIAGKHLHLYGGTHVLVRIHFGQEHELVLPYCTRFTRSAILVQRALHESAPFRGWTRISEIIGIVWVLVECRKHYWASMVQEPYHICDKL